MGKCSAIYLPTLNFPTLALIFVKERLPIAWACRVPGTCFHFLLLDAEGQNPLRGLAKLNAIPVCSIGNIVFKRVGRHVLPLARGQRRARNKRRFKVAANCYLRPDKRAVDLVPPLEGV